MTKARGDEAVNWGVPPLRSDRLSSVIPTRTYGGGPVDDPVRTLFIWRSASLAKARGCTLGFFRWDHTFQAVLNDPDKYAELFLRHGVAAVCEPDCSVWRDNPIEIQAQSVRLARSIGRRWQDLGLLVVPTVNWSDEKSYQFAFLGIPERPPVCAVECRTLQSSADWPYFFAGLQAAVERLKPQSIAIYGGWERRHWLRAYLPAGPVYRLLPSWQTARGWQRKQERYHTQFPLFTEGAKLWAAEVAAAGHAS